MRIELTALTFGVYGGDPPEANALTRGTADIMLDELGSLRLNVYDTEGTWIGRLDCDVVDGILQIELRDRKELGDHEPTRRVDFPLTADALALLYIRDRRAKLAATSPVPPDSLPNP